MTASDSESSYVPEPESIERPDDGDLATADVNNTVSNVGTAHTRSGVAESGERLSHTRVRFRHRATGDEPESGGHTALADSVAEHAAKWEELSGHTHAVGLLDWRVDSGDVRLLTEPTDEGSLVDRFRDGGDVIWPDEAVWLTTRLCLAVENAHDDGTLHHNIDPTTIEFASTESSSWPFPKLGGWGIYQLARDRVDGVRETTVTYAAPEELDPDTFDTPDERTDVYRLGAVLYRMIAGQPPWTGSGYERLRGTLSGESPTPLSETTTLPVDPLVDPLTTALATDPDDRYHSVVAFREALSEATIPAGAATAAAEVTSEESEITAPQTAWTVAADGEVAVGHGTAYIADDEGAVTAYRVDTGEQRWETNPEEYAPALAEAAEQQGGFGEDPSTAGVESPPVTAGGSLCLLTDAGVLAFDPRDGTKLWHRELDADCTDGLAGADSTVYVPADGEAGGEGEMYALDSATGETLWRTPLEGSAGFGDEAATVPAVADDRVVVNTEDAVVSFNTETGDRLWRFESYFTQPPSVTDDRVFVGDDDTLYALEGDTGTEEWRADTEYEVAGAPVVSPDGDEPSVYVTVRDEWGSVTAFTPETGEVRWSYELQDRDETRVPTANAVVDDETVALPLAGRTGDDVPAVELLGVDTADGRELYQHELDEITATTTTHTRGVVILGGNSDSGGADATSALLLPDASTVAVEDDTSEADASGSDSAATDTESTDDLQGDAETLAAVLREERHDELDRDYVPDETGWSEEKTERVLPELEAAGLIELDEWNGMVDVQLVGEPSDVSEDAVAGGGDDLADEPSDAEVLADVLREEPDRELDKDLVPDETGWSEEKTERVLGELESEGIVELEEWQGMVDVRLVSDPAEGDGSSSDSDDGMDDDDWMDDDDDDWMDDDDDDDWMDDDDDDWI